MEIVIQFVMFFQKSMNLIIPLSFTIYLFAYKEQKDIAYSLFKQKIHILYTGFVLISLLFLTINIIFPINIESQKGTNNESFCLIIVMIIIDFLWIAIAFFAYRHLLNTLNIYKNFNGNLNLVKKDLDAIKDVFKKYENNEIDKYKLQKFLENKFKRINICSEILFQIMLSKKKYNLNNDFTNSVDQIRKNLLDPVKDITLDSNVHTKIVSYSNRYFITLEKVVLKGLVDLINVALINNNYKALDLLLDCFENAKPGYYEPPTPDIKRDWKIATKSNDDLEKQLNQMFDEYFYASHRVLDSLYASNNSRSQILLRDLEQWQHQSGIYSYSKDFVTLVTSLIINSIEKGDLKKLTDSFNILLDHYNSFKSKTIDSGSNRIKIQNINLLRQKVNSEGFDEIEKVIYKFTYLSIVKSIELGRYSCAGFLIKTSLINLDSSKFMLHIYQINNDTTNTLYEMGLSKSLSKTFSVMFPFSDSSYKYCLLKANFLIFFQYYYANKIKKISNQNINNLYPMLSLLRDNNYFEYLSHKVKEMNKEYGMIFLKKDHFDDLYAEIRILVSTRGNEKYLSNYASLIKM
ncbi:hypothetical protein [Jeotgalibacillus soli]|uniref:Uncharacterized protein n=1 Tax=Jeotgalibacillus soli TaxID=889306 RepID=A0A0C2V9U1_9BACL|nr:hypothetical protein [Jeotgalibacillus soli]KIL45727.1 hypothetical protein KP78_20760 [Jeotgalibacillus soli]